MTKAFTVTTTILEVETTPTITDPREFETILKCSIKYLFGEYGTVHNMTIQNSDNNNNNDNNSLMIVKCPTKYASQVQASMTMITNPSYITTLYRFDVVKKITTNNNETTS